MKEIDHRQAFLAFSYFAKIGPLGVARLIKYFGEIEKAVFASAAELERAGLNNRLIVEFTKWRANLNLEKIESELKSEKIDFLALSDDDYPILLKEIPAAPYIIYYRGNIKLLSSSNYFSLSVVGSRKHSAYGEKIISEILPAVIENKIIITSGLALGIDALAHKTALANNGATIAVLGTGIDKASIYPPANRTLAEEILKSGGLIISEFPPHTPPLKQNFPQRNRIISGISQATLIIEADLKSGSLITAGYALDQNRDVLAIPGNIFSSFSRGTNNLLKLGAKTITSTNDILEIYNINIDSETIKNGHESIKPKFNNEIEKKVYLIIKDAHDRGELITTEEIINKCALDTSVINSTLSILELRGVAKYDEIGYDIN